MTTCWSSTFGKRLVLCIFTPSLDFDIVYLRTGNFCSPELQAELTDVINLLKQLRSPELCWKLRRPQIDSHQNLRVERRRTGMQCCSARASEAGENHDVKRDALSDQGSPRSPTHATLEEFREDAKSWQRKRESMKETGADAADEIVLSSATAPSSLWIRQMILDQLESIHPSESPATIPCALQPTAMEGPDLTVEMQDSEPIDHKERGMACIAPGFALPCLIRPESNENHKRASNVEMEQDTMAKSPWKGEFFNAKINEMCESFLEHAVPADFSEASPRLAQLGVTQQQDSLKLDAMHREAVESLQSLLLRANWSQKSLN